LAEAGDRIVKIYQDRESLIRAAVWKQKLESVGHARTPENVRAYPIKCWNQFSLNLILYE